MSKPRILHFDLENTPILGWTWSTYQTDVIYVEEPQRVMSWAAKWDGAPNRSVEFRSTFHDDRQTMLERASALLDEADAVVSYNGARHDTPHITTEFLREGIEIPSPYKEIDLWKVTRGKIKLPNNKLDTVLHQFNLGGKVKHEGFGLWLACMAGDPAAWARMKKYNIGDVVEMEKVFNLYRPIIPAAMMPNFNLDRVGEGCPKCPSLDLQRRGFARTTTAVYQRFQCQACGSWSRGKKALNSIDVRGV